MKKTTKTILGTFLISSILLSGCSKIDLPAMVTPKTNLEDIPEIISEIDFLKQPNTNWAAYRETKEIRSIYMTGHTTGWKNRFHELVDFMDSTEINATVIDIKDDYGELTYNSMIPMVKEVEADKTVKDKDFLGTMKLLEDRDIYTIARIVTFKDRTAASKRPVLNLSYLIQFYKLIIN